MFERYKVIHLIGIGGVGMSGIAEVLHNQGYEVTGSDIKGSETVDRLRGMGIKVDILLINKKDKRSMRFSKRIWIPSGRPLKGLLQDASIVKEQKVR